MSKVTFDKAGAGMEEGHAAGRPLAMEIVMHLCRFENGQSSIEHCKQATTMPLLTETAFHNGVWAQWELAEDEAWFAGRLELLDEEAEELATIKGRRRLEWLACRWLVHELLVSLELCHPDRRYPVRKDEFGKPVIEDCPFEVSFSHSNGRVAVMLALAPCGIDVQYFVPKIGRIAHKFLHVEEAESLDHRHLLEHLHLYWTAKEAIYKAWGRKELAFSEHIWVGPFEYAETLRLEAKVEKGGEKKRYEVRLERQGDYFLARSVQV